MSTTARSAARGGKNAKAEAPAGSAQKPPRADREPKVDTRKSGPPVDKPQTPAHDQNRVADDLKKQALLQPTAEQMRMAEIMDSKRGEDLALLKDKIKQVMDATQKTEDEVCTALHDCDNDANRAVNYLLEGVKDVWSMSEKKKKKKTPSATKGESGMNNHVGGGSAEEDWGDSGQAAGETGGPGAARGRERARERTRGGPPRLRGRGSMESRGWRGRENKENERNLEDGERGSRRGGGRMFNGRGGRGGRGGGRLGSRTFQSRDKSGSFPRSIDTWNNPSGDDGSGEKMENWDTNGATEDWDTEEPKPRQNENWGDQFPSPEDWDNEEYTGSLADSKVFTPSSGPEGEMMVPPMEGEVVEDTIPDQPPQPLEPLRPAQMPPSPVAVGTLTQAQTQFLTQLTQQSSERANYAQPPPQTYPTTYPAPPVTYPANYGVGNSYNSDGTVNSGAPLPSRPKTQKPRVPPPSKIPSSAVEMPPGDAITVSLLDVQFGGLEFGSDPEPPAGLENSHSLPPATTVAPTSPTPPPATVAASVATLMESYANSTQQANLANALSQKSDSLLSETVVTAANSYVQTSRPTSLAELSNATAKTTATVDTYNNADNTLYQTQYQKSAPATAYSAPTPVTTYSASSYSTSQVTSSSTAGGYTSQTTGYTSGGSGGYGSSAASQGQGVGGSAQAQTNANSSYPSNTSYANSQAYAYTYPATNYQNNANTGYPQAQSYQSAANNYTSYPQQSHKMNAALSSSQPKDSQYESGQVTSNSIPPASTVSSTPSLGLSTSQTVASTKVTALSTGNKSGMVTGIPQQVPPMINTPYIMSQAAGMPYFQQPMTFSYDDALMLQQRIAPPPMPTQYFDMGFQQQQNSLGTGRDANSLGNVAYSMSDGRFTRTDNNASPVPSSQSVTQGHQQPMLNPTGLPPGYTYIFGSYPNFQYGTPTLYPMAATAAAGNSTSGQYKGPGYGSTGYGSGYEAAPDGYKASYAAAPAQTKTGGTPTTSADLYTKGHAALNKVNSYDKAGFHSGTPPPFSQSVPSGTYPPHLFIGTLPPHQATHAHSAATLMHSHQPLHQDAGNNSGARSQANVQPNKAGAKQQNYSPSFWTNTS